MSDDSIRRTGNNPETTPDSDDVRIDPGPYEAIVMAHITGSRMGELRVKIPDLSGYQATKYTRVSYASPFYGRTYGTDTQELPDSAFTSGQSYGMWMVPPDIGSIVLVTFVAGMSNRGYWFACVYNGPSHHMVPGISRNIGPNTLVPGPELADKVNADSNLPTAEASSLEPNAYTDLVNVNRQPHEYQSSVLIAQGLDRDTIRGAISSSSMREVPSQVYGISTPGPKLTKTDQVPGSPESVISRKGGHSFVMDDGDANGVDQLIRLRTSGGHQILMNDTEDIIYIASKTGNQWLEFSPNGSINIYGAAGFNLRSKGSINLHSDSAIKMNAKAIELNGTEAIGLTSDGSISAKASGSASISADGAVSISAMGAASLSAMGIVSVSATGLCKINGALLMLNCGAGGGGGGGGGANTNSLQDAQNQNGVWVPVPGAIDSICTVVPGHEPWVQADWKTRPGEAANTSVPTALPTSVTGSGSTVTSAGSETTVSSTDSSSGGSISTTITTG